LRHRNLSSLEDSKTLSLSPRRGDCVAVARAENPSDFRALRVSKTVGSQPNLKGSGASARLQNNLDEPKLQSSFELSDLKSATLADRFL